MNRQRRVRAAAAPVEAPRVTRTIRRAAPGTQPATPPTPKREEDPSLAAEEAESRRQADDSARIIKRYIDRIKNPMTAIRARCIQCCGGQPSEVRLCPANTCALWPMRMGDNPYNLKTRKGLAQAAGFSLAEYDKLHGFSSNTSNEEEDE